MPLLDIFRSAPDQVYQFTVKQVVSTAGRGDLVDGKACSSELRAYLREAKSEKLFEYVTSCLENSFDNSGLVLQDLINELGRRLDYEVENGLYKGVRSQIGFDGIWKPPTGKSLVVEVKTSDAYRINLDKIAAYRTRLILEKRISENSSILIVVGREDTGDLEAQVRGSRHAWDIRLISVDALIKLVRLKEEAEEDTVAKIFELLAPFEYTRVDKIIDITFTAAKEVGEVVENESVARGPLETSSESLLTQERTPRADIEVLRHRIIGAVGRDNGQALIKKSAALFWSADENHGLRVACTLSKRYADGSYWYAYHPRWDVFLAGGDKGFFVLGCMDKSRAFALPLAWIQKQVPKLLKTDNERGLYWHVYLGDDARGTFFKVSSDEKINVDEFAVDVL